MSLENPEATFRILANSGDSSASLRITESLGVGKLGAAMDLSVNAAGLRKHGETVEAPVAPISYKWAARR